MTRINKNKPLLEKQLLGICTEIYIVMLLLIFPFIVDSTGFFKILECKYYAFLFIASTYVIFTTLVLLYYWIFFRQSLFKIVKIKRIHKILIVFWILNILSTFLSPYFTKVNLFVGVGRGEGLLTITLYIFTFLYVSLFGKFKKKYLKYISISSLLVSFVCILQYIGFNPFNMYQDGIGIHNVSFMGTIGNVDFISALYTILLTISFTSYIFLNNDKVHNILDLGSVLCGNFIFQIINVNSGKVAFLSLILLLFPFVIIDSSRLSKAIRMLIMVLLGFCLNIIINPVYYEQTHQLKLNFQCNIIVLIYFVILGILYYLSKVIERLEYKVNNPKKIIQRTYVGFAGIMILGIIVLYIYPFSSGTIGEVHELLHGNFNDEFGTYRIFLWKRTIPLIKDYPILGTGADSFALRFMPVYADDVAALGELTINDTAANVYLTMLVNLGILGCGCYLLFIFELLRDTVKQHKMSSIVCGLGVICYLIQDFFNLWVVIVTPIFWLIMGLQCASLKSVEKE